MTIRSAARSAPRFDKRTGRPLLPSLTERSLDADDRAELDVYRSAGADRMQGGWSAPSGTAYRSSFNRYLAGRATDSDHRVLRAALPVDRADLDAETLKHIRHGVGVGGNVSRSGPDTGLERRDLALSGSAGYLVPGSLYDSLVIAMKSFSPILRLARVWKTATRGQAKVPVVAADFNLPGIIQTENVVLAESDPVFTSTATFGAYPYATKLCRYPISLVRDAMLPELATGHAGGSGGGVANAGEGATAPNAGGSALETYLAELLGERLGRGAGADFVNGTGTGQPTGIATAATSGATTTDVGGVTNVALLALLASIDTAYISDGSTWLMNGTTWGAVAALKDSSLRPLELIKWPTGSGPFGQLYGIDVAIVPELASFGAGAGKSPILLGDIQRAYTVRIAGVPQITTLVERYAEFLQRAAFAVTRFDGNITDARAVRALVTT
jgi:hypothetical protein